ncbi:hypothetical protein LR48_Vigan06g018100 [Vigna angularis]|uniref:Cytochrome c oxidase subunit 6b n=1 Tax=Phaseolus angularis TaxID=3914 RepID=A0A0L9UPP4_PHAAN|nr:hypothetical protein LR48_Vigan06g018100 [Vigna angularis]
MSAAQVDPHDKMRARDVNKVARGEQAPRPAHQYGTVSPPSSTHTNDDTKNKIKERKSGIETVPNQPRALIIKFVICIQQEGEKASKCQKLGTYFRSFCQPEWITEWDRERKEGKFPAQI